jgi:hypothetical protein
MAKFKVGQWVLVKAFPKVHGGYPMGTVMFALKNGTVGVQMAFPFPVINGTEFQTFTGKVKDIQAR